VIGIGTTRVTAVNECHRLLKKEVKATLPQLTKFVGKELYDSNGLLKEVKAILPFGKIEENTVFGITTKPNHLILTAKTTIVTPRENHYDPKKVDSHERSFILATISYKNTLLTLRTREKLEEEYRSDFTIEEASKSTYHPFTY